MLIQRSKNMMEEQDDEIKKLNEVILNAKCHAIRDAQLSEKSILKEDIDQEEKRLDTMMEVDRLQALQEYERREQERHRQRLLGAQVILVYIYTVEMCTYCSIVDTGYRNIEKMKMFSNRYFINNNK